MKKSIKISAFLSFLLISCSNRIPDNMVFVKGGSIEMGDNIRHAVYPAEVRDFYISDHEVTNREFADVFNWACQKGYLYIAYGEETKERPKFPYNIGEKFPDYLYVDTDYLVRLNKDNPWPLIETFRKNCQIEFRDNEFKVKEGMDDYPVVAVSWYGAVVYCNFLSEISGLKPLYETQFWDSDMISSGFRLPTNEEWEYAARGGAKSQGYMYSGSDDPEETAWFAANSEGKLHPVKQKLPNELGLYDMSGNAWEFCTEKEGEFAGIIKTGVLSGGLYTSFRLWRGGGYSTNDVNVHIFLQHIDLPTYLQGNDEVGFRIIMQKGKG